MISNIWHSLQNVCIYCELRCYMDIKYNTSFNYSLYQMLFPVTHMFGVNLIFCGKSTEKVIKHQTRCFVFLYATYETFLFCYVL